MAPKMPATKQPAAAPAEDDTGMDEGAGAESGDDEGDEGEGGDQVLCTILKSADGSYRVVEGDEEEEGEEAPEGDGEGDEGGDQGDEGQEGEDEGTVCHSPGEALKAVLMILQKDEEASGGTGQSQFESGFGEDEGGKSPPPKY